MALVESNMMALGTVAPKFKLLDTVTGQELSLEELRSEKATVVMFICNHCPYVLHINHKLVEVSNAYKQKGVQFIGISSNNVETHPQDGPAHMTEVAANLGYSFPYLYDETQEVAKAYGAECTPDFFVFDSEMQCVYRGRFDNSRPGMSSATGADLSNALDAILLDLAVNSEQHPSIGCNIKWK